MALAKWKVGLPKWRQKLGMRLNRHLVETTVTPTKQAFRANRKYQELQDIDCWDCEQIERKLNE